MSCDKTFCGKIGDAVLVFSPREFGRDDQSWSGTIIDCIENKSITVLLGSRDERNKFENGFHEMDEDTEDAAFCRILVEKACEENGVNNIFLC